MKIFNFFTLRKFRNYCDTNSVLWDSTTSYVGSIFEISAFLEAMIHSTFLLDDVFALLAFGHFIWLLSQ